MNFFDTHCFKMVFVVKCSVKFGHYGFGKFRPFVADVNVHVLFNTAKLELLAINFARSLRYRMLSSITVAVEMTPCAKCTAPFAVESPTPNILFHFFKCRASLLLKSETE